MMFSSKAPNYELRASDHPHHIIFLISISMSVSPDLTSASMSSPVLILYHLYVIFMHYVTFDIVI